MARRSSQKTAPRGPETGRRRWRPLMFRLLAVALALAPFVLAEGLLRALDLGRPSYRGDPFVGFSAVHPLFVLSDDGTRYEISPTRLDFFCPDSFAREKPAGEFRIFCFGGSTVQGEPFRKETSFTTWLELSLKAADPSRSWKVVNCGGISYASYRLVPIMEEVLENYQPDLMVVYSGHNEFLEDRTYGRIKGLPPYLAVPAALVSSTRVYQLAYRGWAGWRNASPAPAERPVLKDETDAMLEYQGGLDRYHRNPQWQREVIAHYEYNLRRMVETCRQARVPLVLMNPVANLRDCAPFKAENRPGLTAQELERWKALFLEAAEYQGTDVPRAAALLEAAEQIDDQHAGLHYALGKCYDLMGQIDKAREHYILAKDLDVCPLRILEPMNAIVLDVAADTGTPLIDVRKRFEDLAEGRLPGGYLLIDHVHPSFSGHKLIAHWTVELMAQLGYLKTPPGWAEAESRAFDAHFKSLPDIYFSRGMEKAERLKCWTQGKASRQPPREWSDRPRG